jgi:hypothetical protein
MTNELETRFPGVNRAFDFVMPSYQWSLQRLDADDKRLQDTLTYSATATFAAPALVRALDPTADLLEPWFVAGLIAFLIIGIAGAAARILGTVDLPTPKVFYDTWLTLDDWTFRKDMIYFAGEAMEKNRHLIQRRGLVADLMSGLFAIEVLLFSVGIALAL